MYHYLDSMGFIGSTLSRFSPFKFKIQEISNEQIHDPGIPKPAYLSNSCSMLQL